MSSDSSDISDTDSEDTVHDIHPSFDISLTQTHVAPRYLMQMNQKGRELLPKADVPIVLTCGLPGGRGWRGTYYGRLVRPVIGKEVWMPFVKDNNLTDGYLCTFEVVRCSKSLGVWLNVVNLKGPSAFATPEELDAKRLVGTSADHAIVVD